MFSLCFYTFSPLFGCDYLFVWIYVERVSGACHLVTGYFASLMPKNREKIKYWKMDEMTNGRKKKERNREVAWLLFPCSHFVFVTLLAISYIGFRCCFTGVHVFVFAMYFLMSDLFKSKSNVFLVYCYSI